MSADRSEFRRAVFAAVEDFALEAEELTRAFWAEPTNEGRFDMVPRMNEMLERHMAKLNGLPEPK